jgi:hypothetical protein
MSYSGQYQICAAQQGYYYTNNYTNWTFVSQPNILDCVISGSGQYQILCITNGDLKFSNNYGNSFSTLLPSGSSGQTYNSVAISSTGQYITCYNVVTGCYVSSDYGNSWTNVNISGVTGVAGIILTVSMSSTGRNQVLFYAPTPSRSTGIYISTNYGVTWTNVSSSAGNLGNTSSIFTSAAYQYYTSKQIMSASGNILLAFGVQGTNGYTKLYTATNPSYVFDFNGNLNVNGYVTSSNPYWFGTYTLLSNQIVVPSTSSFSLGITNNSNFLVFPLGAYGVYSVTLVAAITVATTETIYIYINGPSNNINSTNQLLASPNPQTITTTGLFQYNSSSTTNSINITLSVPKDASTVTNDATQAYIQIHKVA